MEKQQRELGNGNNSASGSSSEQRSATWFEELLNNTNTKVVPVEESLKVNGRIKLKRMKEESIADAVLAILSMKQPVKGEEEMDDEEEIPGVENGDFEVPTEWLLMGTKVESALSTTKGVRRLVKNEIVHFEFPSSTSYLIVRISTTRSGEVGRLPMDWARTVIPLVQSGIVKVFGRCISAPCSLQMMEEILVSVSFYICKSVFTEDKSLLLGPSTMGNSPIYPLLQLFRMLEMKPFQKAEFSPEETYPRKRLLNPCVDLDIVAALPTIKKRKGAERRTGGKGGDQVPVQDENEQALSESTLNKLVGAEEINDLEEKDAPETLMCDLKPFQKQALYWMSEIEKGNDVVTEQVLHPFWSAYDLCEGRKIYVNVFTGEATTKYPKATQMARGGILADAMGLGKTVMTIALILSNTGKVNSENNNIKSSRGHNSCKGGTLIVCPMALLGQWKDELEAYSKKDSLSIFVHYSGERNTSPGFLASYDVVLTTYDVLSSTFKTDGVESMYNRVQWYRVVLDEAHTIKNHKSQIAHAAFVLSSHCRWCLTGTPLQNSLEDLYSLLCFLRVEPWCNWTWWNKLIQKPYENNDPRALKLFKAILRTVMLRRTKETKDRNGRPILLLPAIDIQLIECEQSESEHNFYDALFTRSKVQFDQYVAQGKVFQHYANILELLLQLRRCCNHPFLVMCGSHPQKYADLSRLARKFLQSCGESAKLCNTLNDPQMLAELNNLGIQFLLNTDSGSGSQQSPAYIEDVLKHIQNGETIDCPICMEAPDEPVFTPCAHRFCRKCLFTHWRTSDGGKCAICRQLLKKSDLITCPSNSTFKVDIVNNMTESSKVSKLLEFLLNIQNSPSNEKSIVFSQWSSFFDLLENPLKMKGIGFLRYDRNLDQNQREDVLNEFNVTKEKKVLLMPLKAGGVGLNLSAASNVFMMDPCWNPAVEEQAIMRIHRIGQERRVIVRRFIVKGSVEDRLQQVQERKQRMISGALTEYDVRISKIQELIMLFT